MIGLLGGSFNPAHKAHKEISLYAAKALNLREVWWLVTPGNPLKKNDSLPSLETRIEQARELSDHVKIKVSGIEVELKTRFTVDTIREIQKRYPNENFVWLMGSDNFRQFHQWKNWRKIAALIPIIVIDRPGQLGAKAAITLMPYLRKTITKPPCLIFLHGRKNPLSSTAIRALKTVQTRL